MAFDQRNLDDYIDVAERMAEFYVRYPEGSLRAADPLHPWEQATVTGYDKNGQEVTQTFIVYTAVACRHPGDPRPGVGVAWEVFPGRTPYTRGSELMNAETSAWGRAMAALGIATKRGIASRQEVANRRDEAAEQEARALSRRPPETDQDGAATFAEQERMLHDQAGWEHVTPESSVPPRTDWDADERAKPDPMRAAMGAMFAIYKELGVTEKEPMLFDISEILDHPVASRADLTLEEVKAVNGVLRKRRDAARKAGSVTHA